MHQAVTTFGDSSSGLGALGVDGHAFIIQLITFALAYFVLRRYAFGPILKILQERRATIESGVKLGEEMQRERSEFDAKKQQLLQAARQKADSIVSDATDAGRDVVRAAEEKARQKAEAIVKEAHDAGVQDANRLRQQVEKEVVGLISQATEVIIDEKLDDKKDAALMDRALKGQRA